ncbi:MAG: YceD family protein [Methylotenera sp.]|nr:YceD family protein [Methylotenera sp.]
MTKHTLFIDNLAFTKKNECLIENLSLVDCSRLNELLLHAAVITHAIKKPTGSISYKLQGSTDAAGRHLLNLSLTTNLTTTCQRCLGEMPLNLSLNFNYLIGEVSDTDLSSVEIDNSDDIDVQQASQNMDIIALLEDEIIMAMPIAPIHEGDCGVIVGQSGEKANPFAVLKGLIKS